MDGFKMGNDNNGPFQVVCFHCGIAAWGACLATGYGACCKSCLGVTNPEAVVKLEKLEEDAKNKEIKKC